MTHGNVYRYFPSKEALFDAVTEQWLKPVEATYRMIADAPDPAFDKLERMIVFVHRSYRDKLESDPGDPRLIVTETGIGYRLVA